MTGGAKKTKQEETKERKSEARGKRGLLYEKMTTDDLHEIDVGDISLSAFCKILDTCRWSHIGSSNGGSFLSIGYPSCEQDGIEFSCHQSCNIKGIFLSMCGVNDGRKVAFLYVEIL